MIINASGGNADAVMTVAQTLSDTQKAQARTNIGALSSANGAVAATNLASNAVETAKIKDANVTRAKLANDALYSPAATFNSNRAIALTDLGKTLWPQWNSAGVTYTLSLTADVSRALPVGFEVAIAYIISNCKAQISVSGVRMVHAGDGQIAGSSETKTLTIPEIGNMIVLKKFDTQSSAGDLWIVTGNVEVV